jgi:hypothetical protein
MMISRILSNPAYAVTIQSAFKYDYLDGGNRACCSYHNKDCVAGGNVNTTIQMAVSKPAYYRTLWGNSLNFPNFFLSNRLN